MIEKIARTVSTNWASLLSACLLLLFVSCSNDEDPKPSTPPIDEPNPHDYVNSWILEQMNTWYLWNKSLPASADKRQDPESFLNSLLSSEDRFSWIQPDYQQLLNSLQGINREAGYEFVLYREEPGSNNLIAQIVYVKPESPADLAGLSRGDVISHINDGRLTVDTYQQQLEEITKPHTLIYRSLDIDQETFGSDKHISLETVTYSENPNHLFKIIDTGNKKVGYYVYNFFASGTDGNPQSFNDEMDAIFGQFKSEGIDELVLDLRFNSGGSETAANNLASLIGISIDDSKIFFKRQYNAAIQEELSNEPDGESFLNSRFLVKTNNIGTQLTSGRVYILTSSRTASASELIINALKPYMEVFLIGDITYGKNVGSISLFEENDPQNTWGLQPIIVKAYNSLDQSDYSQGFVPDIQDKDNSILLYPLGDIRETLLSKAIEEMTGIASTSRKKSSLAREGKDMVVHSLDRKRRSFNLVIENPIGHK